MQFLTSLVLAAFVGYAGAWYLGYLEGNFALLLLLATVVRTWGSSPRPVGSRLTRSEPARRSSASGQATPVRTGASPAAVSTSMTVGSDTLTVSVTVKEKFERTQHVILDCQCVNQEGRTVIRGTAEVLAVDFARLMAHVAPTLPASVIVVPPSQVWLKKLP